MVEVVFCLVDLVGVGLIWPFKVSCDDQEDSPRLEQFIFKTQARRFEYYSFLYVYEYREFVSIESASQGWIRNSYIEMDDKVYDRNSRLRN